MLKTCRPTEGKGAHDAQLIVDMQRSVRSKMQTPLLSQGRHPVLLLRLRLEAPFAKEIRKRRMRLAQRAGYALVLTCNENDGIVRHLE